MIYDKVICCSLQYLMMKGMQVGVGKAQENVYIYTEHLYIVC